MKKILIISFTLLFASSFAQVQTTRKDSLMGGFTIDRTCFDVIHYALDLSINPDEKSIKGSNTVIFDVLQSTQRIQLDLFANMHVDSIIWNQKPLNYSREFNAVFIDFPKIVAAETRQQIQFYYSGNPMIAKRAPWDGGFVFTKDKNNRPWIAVAVQGTGASLWYPVKDGQSDEPDKGATIRVAVPNGLMAISNGRLVGSTPLPEGYTRWDWEVVNPINNYAITVNIGNYSAILERYNDLNLTYYVLDYNKERALQHFEEVKPMLTCFESKFGPYPFKEDGYKLVETPYLGMEHQSAIAYGNKYLKGYLGSDLSGTGVGLLFDFITIHESGHEWFGNSITSRDIADMWIHEGFTQYSELVYIECQFGYKKAMQYGKGLQRNVVNDRPIIGPKGVNKEGSGDMYPKGALLLNTMRHALNDDAKWWSLLLKYSTTFKHTIIDTATVLEFFNQQTEINWTTVFEQYLQKTKLPELQLRKSGDHLEVRWNSEVSEFSMPIVVAVNGNFERIFPTNIWAKTTIKITNAKEAFVDPGCFYIKVAYL